MAQCLRASYTQDIAEAPLYRRRVSPRNSGKTQPSGASKSAHALLDVLSNLP